MRRRLLLLVLPLAALTLNPERPSWSADEGARVRFPADVPPRNDIRLENRVPIPMRDGVRIGTSRHLFKPRRCWSPETIAATLPSAAASSTRLSAGSASIMSIVCVGRTIVAFRMT